MTTEREQFEAWWESLPLSERIIACHPVDAASHFAYKGWQARAAREALDAENVNLRELLAEARTIIERAATIKMNDGTYFDKDCACTLFLISFREKP